LTRRQKMPTIGRTLLCCLLVVLPATLAQVLVISADGTTDTYTLLANALGSEPIDGPDCSHPSFGHHIDQTPDKELSKPVFRFYLHVTPDNDRCINFDRQRNEIKVYGGSEDSWKGHLNDTFTYEWKFQLPTGFLTTYSFCHIHQIKGGDGDSQSGDPLITLTPRKGNPNIVQLIHVDSTGAEKILAKTNLTAFLGTWVHATEKIRYGHDGTYSLSIVRISDGAMVFQYTSSDIDIWVSDSSGTTFCRPKWGIYRSLKDASELRDEVVLFDDFSVAKGNDKCPT